MCHSWARGNWSVVHCWNISFSECRRNTPFGEVSGIECVPGLHCALSSKDAAQTWTNLPRRLEEHRYLWVFSGRKIGTTIPSVRLKFPLAEDCCWVKGR